MGIARVNRERAVVKGDGVGADFVSGFAWSIAAAGTGAGSASPGVAVWVGQCGGGVRAKGGVAG